MTHAMFDLDGTLVQDEQGYDSMSAADYLDTKRLLRCQPVRSVIQFARDAHAAGCHIDILTGRPRVLRATILELLAKHGVPVRILYQPREFEDLDRLAWWKAGIQDAVRPSFSIGDMESDRRAAELAEVPFRWPHQVPDYDLLQAVSGRLVEAI